MGTECITPPGDQHAPFAVLFWHKNGSSTDRGHGAVAPGLWALRNGPVTRRPKLSTEVTTTWPEW